MLKLSDYDIENLVEYAPASVLKNDSLLTLLTQHDRMIYYWAAKKFFNNKGTIVDAGPLVGGSTSILAEASCITPL